MQRSRAEPFWKRSEKTFGPHDVGRTLAALAPLMGLPSDGLIAERADRMGSYVLPIRFGRTVSIHRR